jgi:hypothetical protein
MRAVACILIVGACGSDPNEPSGPSVPFVPGEYTVEVRGATLSPARPDASAWDDDGPPDPYAIVWHGARRFGVSLGASDTITPLWKYTFRWALAVGETDMLALDVYDDDGSTDELMLACEIAIGAPEVLPDEPTVLRYTCARDGGQVEVWLRRKPE